MMNSFADMSWHDCTIRGLELRVGDADEQDWTSDLVLDIDYIVEWICATDGGVQFRMAPATLVFHNATDLRVHLDWGASGYRTALQTASIDRLERVPIENQQVHLDRPYYAWRILLNWPRGGELTFGATHFTQTLRREPILSDQPHLSLKQRESP
jgi:hypothetical protein